MMKTFILLAFAAVCISATLPDTDRLLLMSLYDSLNETMKELPNTEIFLRDLKGSCTNVFFCQAEDELTKKVSGLSGPKFEPFRTDKKIMRNLNAFNKRHMETCKPADNVEIIFPEFLKNMILCIQKRLSKLSFVPK